MTMDERVKVALNDRQSFSADNNDINNLIAYAYYKGKCEKSKLLCDEIHSILSQMFERANKCRYHKMAKDIIGIKSDYVYDCDYEQWHKLFANDKVKEGI